MVCCVACNETIVDVRGKEHLDLSYRDATDRRGPGNIHVPAMQVPDGHNVRWRSGKARAGVAVLRWL